MEYQAFIGTNAVEGSKGIYTLSFSDDHDMHVTSTVKGFNSGFLTISADKKYLYATRENMIFHASPCGGVGAYKIGEHGVLTLGSCPTVRLVPSIKYSSTTTVKGFTHPCTALR